MKKIILFAVALTVVLFSGCESCFTTYYEYRIENSSNVDLIVETNVIPEIDWYDVPVSEITLVGSKEIVKWSDSNHNKSKDIPGDRYLTFSFTFPDNGVVHTFGGDMIENDFRYLEYWKLECHPDGSNSQIYTYTYTFTQEDYERIMALHK